MSDNKYTFGTTPEAAGRLEAISRFFNPLAEKLIGEYVRSPITAAVDIGCGPGFTTDMLRRATKAKRTVGLDNSGEFLALAKNRFPECEFLVHDVTAVPFPIMASVLYVRFVLSHLKKPVERINQWITQLSPGGILVLEETEAVATEVAPFRRYLTISEKLVATQDTRLFVGSELAGGSYNAKVLLDDCAVWTVPDNEAASWFLPNARSLWPKNPRVLEFMSAGEIEELTAELARMADSTGRDSHVTWHIRRIVLRRDYTHPG